MRGGPIDSARFGSFGKRISVFSQIMGCAFKWGGLRKLHPRILPWNGMRFRTGVQKETASRFDVGTANKSRTVIWRGLEFAESLMLAGVRTEINERLERYNDTLWRPYALFPPFCYICLRHCACRNGGHPLSPVFIFNRPSVRCNDLARYPGRMPRGVCSWCCAMQGGNEKAEASRCHRCFPWCYCNGSRMGRPGFLCSRRLYSNRVCTDLVVTWRFVCLVLCWVAASLICYLGHGGLSFDAEVDTD